MSTYLIALPTTQAGAMAGIGSAQNIFSDTGHSIWLLRDDSASLESLTSDASLAVGTLKLPDVATIAAPQPIAVIQSEPDALMAQALSLDTALGQIGGG